MSKFDVEAQTMAPAPLLPPVGEEPGPGLLIEIPAGASPSQGAGQPGAPQQRILADAARPPSGAARPGLDPLALSAALEAAPPQDGGPPWPALAAAVASQQLRIAEAHQRYAQLQARAYADVLALQQRALEGLHACLGVGGGAPVPTPSVGLEEAGAARLLPAGGDLQPGGWAPAALGELGSPDPRPRQRAQLSEAVEVRSPWLSAEGRMPAGVALGLALSPVLAEAPAPAAPWACQLTLKGALPGVGEALALEVWTEAAPGGIAFGAQGRCADEARLILEGGWLSGDPASPPPEIEGLGDGPRPEDPQDPPHVRCAQGAFSPAQVSAFADGRAADCFGPGFQWAHTHVRSPRPMAGHLRAVDLMDLEGGAFGRGHLRAHLEIPPTETGGGDAAGASGPLAGALLDGCLAALSFYLAAQGFTLERDGWRFEPVMDEAIALRGHGAPAPGASILCEIHVLGVTGGDLPTLYGRVECSVGGRPLLTIPRLGVRLVPDWPLELWKRLGPPRVMETGDPVPLSTLGGLVGAEDPRACVAGDGSRHDYASMLVGAWGAPPPWADVSRRFPRSPGPPILLVTRAARVDGPFGEWKPGLTAELEYDVPAAAWYFAEEPFPTMPWCIFMEIVLQSCGWLAFYVGSAWTSDVDLMFRNLDGTGTLTTELPPGPYTLMTRVSMRSNARFGGMILQTFDVEAFIDGERIYEMETVFGFFPKEAFEQQVGLPVSDAHRARVSGEGNLRVDLKRPGAPHFEGSAALPGPMLLMVDRVTGWWPEGGEAGLGYLRGEKDVDPAEWFFKAHFYQDPVQPGSLGIQALCQLVEFAMLERGMAAGIEHPHFEPIRLGHPLTWKYRGQVTPRDTLITTEIEFTEVGEDDAGPYAVAKGWLWVDGRCIYSAVNLGMRIVSGPPVTASPRRDRQAAPAAPEAAAPAIVEGQIDPNAETWVRDHCPTWTVPAFPAMAMVDRMAGAASAYTRGRVSIVTDCQIRRWMVFGDEPLRVRTEVAEEVGAGASVILKAWRNARDPALSRFELTARCQLQVDVPPPPPTPLAALGDPEEVQDPYTSGRLFHGPTLQIVTHLYLGTNGSRALLDAGLSRVPYGTLNQGVLDAATHAIPHDELWRWSPEIPRGHVGYPFHLIHLYSFAPLPAEGPLRVEVRFVGFEGEIRYPTFLVHILRGEEVLLEFRLIEVLMPLHLAGIRDARQRQDFLGQRFVPGVRLSRFDGARTHLSSAEVQGMDWLPGTVASTFGLRPEERGDVVAQVAVREHVAAAAGIHPARVEVAGDLTEAFDATRPFRAYPVRVIRDGLDVAVEDAGPPAFAFRRIRDAFPTRRDLISRGMEDLWTSVGERFVSDLVFPDPQTRTQLRGLSCLYLANHQVGIESPLFALAVSAISGVPTLALAKVEHQESYLGLLTDLAHRYPGIDGPRMIEYIDRGDSDARVASFQALAEEIGSASRSVLIHVEGTRAHSCRAPTVRMTGVLLDMAIALGVPVVPVKFVGGLPVAPAQEKLEFPLGFGRQEYWIGSPLAPEALSALGYRERKALVLDAIAALGPAEEEPLPPDPAFERAVLEMQARTGAAVQPAAFLAALSQFSDPGEEAQRLLGGLRRGELILGSSPEDQWLAELARWLYGPRGPGITAR